MRAAERGIVRAAKIAVCEVKLAALSYLQVKWDLPRNSLGFECEIKNS
jgi:hypothetical protein